MNKHFTSQIFSILLAVIFLAALAIPVQAQGGSAAALIAEVNSLRASNGLAAYEVDSTLMALAQNQSDYMASIETCTHTRADGSGPGAEGISAENVACGISLSVHDAVYYQWSDALHSATLLGPTKGWVGAGVAVVNGSVYYTLAVKRGAGSFDGSSSIPPGAPPNTLTPSSGSASAAATKAPAAAATSSGKRGTATLQPREPLQTSTPRPDGMIVHVVQPGETALQIAGAYNIKLDDLYSYNDINPKNPVIYAGARLTIRYAFTPTASPTITNTPPPPTRTPTITRTPVPTRTIGPTVPPATLTAQPFFQLPPLNSGRKILGLAVTGISLAGLLYIIFNALLARRKK